jgi:hypothetical protein
MYVDASRILACHLSKTLPFLGASPEDWVRLNVGGTVFETTRATLTQDPESMLGIMFSSESWKRFVAGVYMLRCSC